MSDTVRSTVPGLFIVPTIAFSPCSTGFAVTTPSIGRRDRRLLQAVLVREEVRARLLDAALVRALVRAGRVERELGLLEVLLGLDLRLEVLLRRASRSRSACSRVNLSDSRWAKRASRPGLRRLRARVVLDLVDLEEEVALLDVVAFDDGERHDLPHDLRRDVDLRLGAHAAVAAHGRDERGLRDFRRRDAHDVLVPALDRGIDDESRGRRRPPPRSRP